MVGSTSKISNLIRGAETSRVNPDVRAAALVWIISLLSTVLLVIVVCLVRLAPA
jgi:hypothetical protein